MTNEKTPDSAASALSAGVGAWLPIETAPANTDILCYSEDYEPRFFVGRYSLVEKRDEVLVSESTHKSGRRRIYEERTTTEREWGNECPSWGATHWMPLPEAPNVEVTGAAQLHRAASRERSERGRPPGWASGLNTRGAEDTQSNVAEPKIYR